MNCVWYKKYVTFPESFSGKRVILHIGACDYETRVFVDGEYVGTHRGGYTPMSFDITDKISAPFALIAIEATDDTRSLSQMTGKQSMKDESYGCFYTRTTGIWQTVWLEAVEKAHIVNYNVQTDIENASATFTLAVTEAAFGGKVFANVTYRGEPVGEAFTKVSGDFVTLTVKISEVHLWDVGRGELYDVDFELWQEDGSLVDSVRGYFGMRTVAINREGMFINDRYVFGRFVLDQGFYPDGIYTAPTEAALIADIENSMALGFNGARLHQKVFEPRFLYHADRLGYLVWGETPNWGWDHVDGANIYGFLPEWLEEMDRDMAHPSIIGWCPLNETFWNDNPDHDQNMMRLIYDATRAKDPTRPVVINSGSMPCFDLSGNILGCTFDVHEYEQDPEKFKAVFSELDSGIIREQLHRRFKQTPVFDTGKSLFVSEYGGIAWIEDGEGWGYGKSVESKNELLERLKGLTDALLENPYVMGFCYTQLTDVEQEKNGLMTYDRRFKFDPKVIAEIIGAKSLKEK
jgi:beta-galactosidase/beta-glucuronidase